MSTVNAATTSQSFALVTTSKMLKQRKNLDFIDDDITAGLMTQVKKNIEAKKDPKAAVPAAVPMTYEDLTAEVTMTFAEAMAQLLFQPLAIFIRYCLLQETCKMYRIDVPEGTEPRMHRFFVLDGRRNTFFPFDLNTRLIDKQGRSVSFVDACFGPQKEDSNCYSDRDIENSWFRKMGKGFEHSPFFYLRRKLYDTFKVKMDHQVVLTLTTLPAKPGFVQGLSVLEVVWDRNTDKKIFDPKSNWQKYLCSNMKDGFGHQIDTHDEMIMAKDAKKIDVSKFVSWSCSENINFHDEIQQMQDEIKVMQSKIQFQLEKAAPQVEIKEGRPNQRRKKAQPKKAEADAYAEHPPPLE